jgi:hypothetical protein
MDPSPGFGEPLCRVARVALWSARHDRRELMSPARTFGDRKAAGVQSDRLPDEDPAGWTTWAVIVSLNPLAAGFVDEPRVPFACVRGLERMLIDDADPSPGHLPDVED